MSRTLLEQWRDMAYDEKVDRGQLQRFWGSYFQIEKEIYEQLLENPQVAVCWSGAFTGVLFSPNLFTVGVASLLGIPGVIAMLIFKLIFRA